MNDIRNVDWISAPETARRLGVTLRTVHGFIDRGELSAFRMGRVIRVRVVDLEAFIEGCRIDPGTLGRAPLDLLRAL